MPKSNILYSPEAIRDLDEIWSYISDELQNPDSATDTVGGIMDMVDNLNRFPQMGSPLSPVIHIECTFRFLICGNYIAFYHIDGDIVYVDRVLYGKRDYIHILFEKE